jgi:hypothetical protein
MIQVPFVEGTLVIDGDFGVALKNVRQSFEGIGRVGGYDISRGGRQGRC